MSDYLSSLAARSLRREPACEPRRAQMFEPRQETPGASLADEAAGAGLPGVETFEGISAQIPVSAAAPISREPAVYEGDGPGPDSYASPQQTDAQAAPRSSTTTRTSSTPPDALQVPGPLKTQSPLQTPAPPALEHPPHEPASPHTNNATTETADETAGTHAPRDVMLFPQTLPGHSNPPAADPKRISTPATGSEETRGARPSTPLIKTSSASPSRQTLAAPEESGEAIRPVASARPLRPDAVDEESREQATPFVRPAAVEPRAGQLETEGETTVVNLEIVPLPHASNRLQPASVREGSAQAAAPPPTIEVTIGRIEVRAVTPPVPPPQQRVRESPPKMSLDDYLRANSGGRK